MLAAGVASVRRGRQVQLASMDPPQRSAEFTTEAGGTSGKTCLRGNTNVKERRRNRFPLQHSEGATPEEREGDRWKEAVAERNHSENELTAIPCVWLAG